MDCQILIRDARGGKSVSAPFDSKLLDVLVGAGYYLPAACGGNGTCGKCRVKVLSGTVEGGRPDAEGRVLSCLARVRGDLEVEVPETTGGGLDVFTGERAELGKKSGFGIALDVGTTTVAAFLVDLASGRELDKISCLNPQGSFGADVISRIQTCSAPGSRERMQALILETAKDIVARFRERCGGPIREMTVCGNPTMLHLFCGEDPTGIGSAPFTPVFTELRAYRGEELGLEAERVVLLPSAATYIGSDITAGALAVGMARDCGVRLFLDVGTNGELVLSDHGRLVAVSTAAGPALEGACISCGMGGIAGAVDRVERDEKGGLTISTIGGAPAKGLCGCGLVDLIALLLEDGTIDEGGCFDEDGGSGDRLCDDRFQLTPDIYLTQGDIRQFQLAKSAIHAGIRALLADCGVAIESVDCLYLAGGLGYYLDVGHAIRTGLLPAEFAGKVRVVGNSAVYGAKLCLLDDDNLDRVSALAKACGTVELSTSEVFFEEYVVRMGFEE